MSAKEAKKEVENRVIGEMEQEDEGGRIRQLANWLRRRFRVKG